jgi:hypothetical protein
MKLIMRLAIIMALASAVPLAAQTTYDWSMVGSCGVLDGASVPNTTSGPTLTFNSNLTGSIVARYPVTNTYGGGISKTPGWQWFSMTYTDDSASGSVVGALYRVDKCSNSREVMCQVTSGTSDGPTCGRCLFNPGELDFANNTYFVEVTLNRTSSAATEAVHIVGLDQ